jgi:hypothetical protein
VNKTTVLARASLPLKKAPQEAPREDGMEQTNA